MFKFFKLPKVPPENITPLIKEADNIDEALKERRRAFEEGQKRAKDAFEETLEVTQELLEERKVDGRNDT
jgi:hypothetical protein